MKNLLPLAVFLLGSLGALGQKPPDLETFTNPDGAFHFLYPANYELLVGDRMLKATQGRHVGIPVCDFSTAFVCVIYPLEELDDSRFEAAGFSVDGVPGVTSESDCLSYADPSVRTKRDQPRPSALNINGRVFRYVSSKRTIPGHTQFAHLYRTFRSGRCYQLRIAASLSDEQGVQPPSKSAGNAEAESARESLKLILSTFAFE